MPRKTTKNLMTTTKKRKITDLRYYCNQKFWWLSVDIEKCQTLSCCAATPSRINLEWLSQNSGGLFNTPALQIERQAMLDNIPVSSCSATCWTAEKNQLISRRLAMQGNLITHTNLNARPETLHIIVGSNCNMTCVYCCKQFSTAWKQDIINNGPYAVPTADDRFKLNQQDQILLKIGQKNIAKAQFSTLLLEEIAHLIADSPLNEVHINGGETFLYLNLEQLIANIPKNLPIQVWSGLGVDTKRFTRELDKLDKFENVTISISAENTNSLYEFTRYGNTWARFQANLKEIQVRNIPYRFNATISNLTVFGLQDFINFAGDTPITIEPCTDPEFLAINILDPESRNYIPNSIRHLMTDSIPTEVHRQHLKIYLQEFAVRRNLNLTCFPKSFITWINE